MSDVNDNSRFDDMRSENVLLLSDDIQKLKVEINTLAGIVNMTSLAALKQSNLIAQRNHLKYMLKIIDVAPNPSLSNLKSMFDQQKFDEVLSADELTTINTNTALEPTNYFKTKYIVPGIELIDNFIIARSHQDSPELFIYITLPLFYWDDINVQVIDKSEMTDTTPGVRWLPFSSAKRHRLNMFNPSKPAHVIVNELFKAASKIMNNPDFTDEQ